MSWSENSALPGDKEVDGGEDGRGFAPQAGGEQVEYHAPGRQEVPTGCNEQAGAQDDTIVVCVSESPHAPHLVRRAERIARARHLRWVAVYIETPRYFRLSSAERDRVAQTLRLAGRLGAEVVRLPADEVPHSLVEYARSRNAAALVVGKPPRTRWQLLPARSLFQGIIDCSGSLDVYAVEGEAEAPRRPRQAATSARRFHLRHYLYSTAIMAIMAALVLLLRAYLPTPNLSILFLTAVLISAARWGLGASVYATVVSILLYDFFFVTPVAAWTSPRPQDLLSLLSFLLVAVITSNLTAQVRAQVEAARQREIRTAALYALSHQLAQAAGLDAIIEAVVNQVSLILGVRAVVLLPDSRELTVRAVAPPDGVLNDHAIAVATAIWQQRQDAGAETQPRGDTGWQFLPLKTAHGTVGVLGVSCPQETGSVFDERRLLEALAGQAAVAIERANLVQDMAQARLLAETDRLRTALLSSISHDLRTPLASIIGATSSLLNYSPTYDEAIRQALLQTVLEEAERLDRFVANLLSMTRLESGALRLKRSLAEPKDLIGSTLTRLAERLAQRNVLVDVAPDCPPVNVDFVLMEQVLFNVLDNAIKYSADGSSIRISARRSSASVIFEVADEGIGVAEDDLERIFDKFYRVNEGDAHGAGTGLGLSICRGIVDAHGGQIFARLPPGGPGLILHLELPSAEEANSQVLREVIRD